MARCGSIRPMLHRAIEGEVSPLESLRLGRHLPSCTSCRILLARENRLAEMLDRIEDSLAVDGDFTQRVMAALPAGPPESGSARSKRRGLGIVALAGIGMLGAAGLSRLSATGSADGPLPGLPRISSEGFQSLNEIFSSMFGFFMLVVARAGTGLEASLPTWSPESVLLPLAVIPVALGLGTLSMLVALASGGWTRLQAIPRVFIRLSSVWVDMPSRLAVPAKSPRSSVSTRRT